MSAMRPPTISMRCCAPSSGLKSRSTASRENPRAARTAPKWIALAFARASTRMAEMLRQLPRSHRVQSKTPMRAQEHFAGAPVLAPARADERNGGLDAVRGFALLGILLLNICAFGLPSAAYVNPAPAGGATGANLVLWALITVLADGKMRAIFSLTFGASVYLLVDRLCRKGAGADAADIHYRRMLWLMLFGILHAYLIWWGDILYYYASLGLVLYPLRKLSARALLIFAGILGVGLSALPI